MTMACPAGTTTLCAVDGAETRATVGKRQGNEWEGERGEAGHAIAILDATVRSLSSFALFFSNACCRQLSRFWQLWCSGMRCCRSGREAVSVKTDGGLGTEETY